jgi:hypothetical protein
MLYLSKANEENHNTFSAQFLKKTQNIKGLQSECAVARYTHTYIYYGFLDFQNSVSCHGARISIIPRTAVGKVRTSWVDFHQTQKCSQALCVDFCV